MIRLADPNDTARISEIVELAYRPYVASIGAVPGPLLDDYPGHVAAKQAWVTGDPVMGVLVLVILPAASAIGERRRINDEMADALRREAEAVAALRDAMRLSLQARRAGPVTARDRHVTIRDRA